jgi:phage gp36-like protein
MAYCTQTDIEKRLTEATLIELTDDAGAGSVDVDVVDAAISDAGEQIDAYLAMRYSLPLASTPGIVTRLAADLAVCALYARRAHLNLPDPWRRRCDAAERILEQLGKGALSLDVPSPAGSADDGIAVTSDADDRVFSRGRTSAGTTGTLDNY